MKEPLVCVFDCTLFAQALINPRGPAGACIAAAQAGNLTVLLTEYVTLDLAGNAEFTGRFPALKIVSPPDLLQVLKKRREQGNLEH